ncbi:F0F1 ATP synthase subunit B [Flavicella sediminum]|uniref:F0F1 ATP synthase subunit B n=1 Tax=Flavicella sediminum TaxID=2585141 RepID=UPI00112358F0|nr:F0F1 ATP synthase subunit B [Flavicella sediminum]
MEKLIEQFSLGLFFWQSVLFVALVLLLKKFAWKPILEAVNDREEGIKDALESAEAAKKEMQSLTADNQRILKEARAERDSLLKDAREIKEKIIAEAKEEAQEEASAIIDSAKAAIEVEKKAAISELKTQVAHLSIEIAEKVVKRELASKDDQLALVDKILGEVTLN